MPRYYQIDKAAEILALQGELQALKFAARLKCLGKYRDAIQRGYSAYCNPSSYLQMDQDPKALVSIGLKALRELLDSQGSRIG